MGWGQLSDGRSSDRCRTDRRNADLLIEHPPHQRAQPPHFFVIDGATENPVRRQKRLREQQAILHHRQPGRILEIVLVENGRRRGVVRGIRVDAGHLPPVPRLQQVQRLEVLPMHEQTIDLLVQRAGVGERRQKAVGEVVGESPMPPSSIEPWCRWSVKPLRGMDGREGRGARSPACLRRWLGERGCDAARRNPFVGAAIIMSYPGRTHDAVRVLRTRPTIEPTEP